jgi:hypothetical protein
MEKDATVHSEIRMADVEQENSGLIALANIIGYALAVPFTFTSDRLAAHLTKRNGMVREAEMRLGVLLPAMLIVCPSSLTPLKIPLLIPSSQAPAGLVVYGVTAQNQLHWIGYFAGVAMTDWGSYFYFTFTLAYAVDSYPANTSEMLIAMCIGKQIISFAFGLYLLEWVETSGYVVIIAGVFVAGLSLALRCANVCLTLTQYCSSIIWLCCLSCFSGNEFVSSMPQYG